MSNVECPIVEPDVCFYADCSDRERRSRKVADASSRYVSVMLLVLCLVSSLLDMCRVSQSGREIEWLVMVWRVRYLIERRHWRQLK